MLTAPVHVTVEGLKVQFVFPPRSLLESATTRATAVELATSAKSTLSAPASSSVHAPPPKSSSRTRLPAAPVTVSVPVTVCVEPAANWMVFPAVTHFRSPNVVSPLTRLA